MGIDKLTYIIFTLVVICSCMTIFIGIKEFIKTLKKDNKKFTKKTLCKARPENKIIYIVKNKHGRPNVVIENKQNAEKYLFEINKEKSRDFYTMESIKLI